MFKPKCGLHDVMQVYNCGNGAIKIIYYGVFSVAIGERSRNLTFGAGPRTRAGHKQPPKLTICSEWKFL